MICLKCNTFHAGFVGRLCPVCSEPLQLETNTNRDKLVLGRLREYLSSWQKSGIVSKKAISEMEAALANTNLPQKEIQESSSFGLVGLFLEWFQNLITVFFASLGALFEPMIQTPNSIRLRKNPFGKEADASYESLTEGILSGDNSGSSNLSGLDGVAELDEKPKRRKGKYSVHEFKSKPKEPEFEIWSGLRPLFNEYIWWFIGSLLVLTGSIMGIREAWLVLSGLNRHLTVLGAVALYEFLFTALGIFLGTRSVVTGRLLTVISLLLLPVSFSVVSDVLLENVILGILVLVVLTGITSGILSIIAKQFQLAARDFIFVILPSLVVQSLIPFSGSGIYSIILSFLPLAIVSYSGRKFISSKAGSKGLFLLSIYGAICVLAIYLNQPFENNSSFQLGSLSLGVLFLWMFGLCAILAITFGTYGFQNEPRRIYTILEILILAVTLVIAAISGIFLYSTQAWEMNEDSIRFLYILIPIIVSILFFDTIPRHEMAIHPFMVLSICSSYLLVKEIIPPTIWSIAFAPIVPITGMLYSKDESPRMKTTLYAWGNISGVISCLGLIYFSSLFQFNDISVLEVLKESFLFIHMGPILAGGLYFAVISHSVARWSNSILHLSAAFGTFTFIYGVFLFFFPMINSISRFGISLGLVSVLYHFAAVKFEKVLRKAMNEENDSLFQPMDDISLLSGTLSVLILLFVFIPTSTFENTLVVLTGIILIIRSFRDNSSFSSFIGSLLISLAVLRLSIASFSVPTTAISAFVSSSIALGASFLCIFFPNLAPALIKSRKVFFVFRLPFAAQGPVLIRNALAATALIYVLYSVSLIFIWLGLADQPERNLVILSGVLLALLFSIAFFTRAFYSFYLRGSVISLTLIFICIGLAAVANRIGRPLPPNVVGLNLTLGIIALWIFSRALFYKGQVIADWLDNPTQGKNYHHVPLSAMLLLGLVLFLDVGLLQPTNISRFLYITPPTFFIGAGLAAFFYSLSLNTLIPLHFSFGLMIVAASLGFVQESLLGTKLIPLDLPGSRWVPLVTEAASRNGNWLDPNVFLPSNLNQTILIIRAANGIAFAGAIYCFCVLVLPLTAFGAAIRKIVFRLEDFVPIQFLFSSWGLICTGLLGVIAFQYAFITPGIIAFVGGGFLVLAGHSRIGNLIIALNGLFIIHGLAHQGNIYPIWAGPLLACIALLMVMGVKPVSLFSKKPYSRILESSHVGALIYSTVGFIYALATLSTATIDNAVPGLIRGMFFAMSGIWMQTLALGITSLLAGISLSLGGFQWTKGLTTLAAMGSVLVFGFSGITSFPVLCQYGICTEANTVNSLPGMIPYFALILAVVLSIASLCSIFIKERREDFALGVGYGSDLLILITGVLIAVFIRLGITSNLLFSEFALIGSILLVTCISIFTSFQYRRQRHLYFSQTSIASLYLALKPAFPEILTPEVDAIAALVFGFILTGVTTVARRTGIPPLEESTRRFAAIMPVVAAIVLPTEVSYGNAGMATFSAALYAALATTSSNRIYAVLSALAASFAIFTAIMASNVQGFEVYLAPVGLFFLFLGHIFSENLTEQARKIIRIGGGLLLYLPAAINISFEMGRAQDASYPVVFGLLCLAGISTGMLFQIRSYLFMGVSFFTLNLVANFLQKGLRDQGMGFILLSLAGLFIIGGLVFYTLKRDQILGFVERTQKDLAKWD